MFQFLEKQKYPVILTAFGFLLVIISHFEVKDIAKLQILKAAYPIYQLYGIGTGIFIEQLLSSKQKVLFLSVTTKRAGEGLRAEMSYIFKAVNEIQRIVADKRLSSVYVPLIGSGHGGLKKEVALFGMLLAVCDVLTRPSGHNIKVFNIVVF